MQITVEQNFRGGSKKAIWFLLINTLLSVAATVATAATEVNLAEVPELVESPLDLAPGSTILFEWHHFPTLIASKTDFHRQDHLTGLPFYQNAVNTLLKLQSGRFQFSRQLPLEFLTSLYTSLPDPPMTA